MAHLVNASYNILGAGGVPTALSEISGHPEDKWGGAVMAALQIKNLPTGAGDDFKIDVSYSKGVTKAVISTSGASPSFAMFGGTDVPGAYQSVGFGQTADAVYVPGLVSPATSSWWMHGVSVVRSTTTGIPTGRPACSAATLRCATVAAFWTSPRPRVHFALTTPSARLSQALPAIRTTMSPRLV